MGRNIHIITKEIQVQATSVANFAATLFPPEILPHLTFSCSEQETELSGPEVLLQVSSQPAPLLQRCHERQTVTT